MLWSEAAHPLRWTRSSVFFPFMVHWPCHRVKCPMLLPLSLCLCRYSFTVPRTLLLPWRDVTCVTVSCGVVCFRKQWAIFFHKLSTMSNCLGIFLGDGVGMGRIMISQQFKLCNLQEKAKFACKLPCVVIMIFKNFIGIAWQRTAQKMVLQVKRGVSWTTYLR